MTHSGLLEEEDVRRGLYRALIEYCAESKEDLAKELAALTPRMSDNRFIEWMKRGIEGGFVDEQCLQFYLSSAYISDGMVSRKRRMSALRDAIITRQLHADQQRRSAEENDDDDGDEVAFAVPAAVGPRKEKRKALTAAEPEPLTLPPSPHPSMTSISEGVKKYPRLSSVSSYYVDSEDDEAQEIDDADEVEGGGLPPGHDVMRFDGGMKRKAVRRFWSMILEVDWNRNKTGDDYPKNKIVSLRSSDGLTLYVLGDYRETGYKKSHYRHVLIATDAGYGQREMRLKARAFFRAGQQYRPNTCYFNVSNPQGLKKPFDYFKTLHSKCDAAVTKEIRAALQLLGNGKD